MRLHLPELLFVSEIKQTKGFIGTMCKKLRFVDRWTVSEPVGRKGGLMLAWNENVQVRVIRCTNFCIEAQVSAENGKEQFWATFLYASTDANERNG